MQDTKIDVSDVSAQLQALRKKLRGALNDLGNEYDVQIDAILKIANGDVEIPADERKYWLKLVDSALFSLQVPLVGVMGGDVLPEGFWRSALGQAFMLARATLTDDVLITRAEAARRLYGEATRRNLMRVKRLADAGRLTPYRDPDDPPNLAGRLSAREVQRLIDEGER